jgi:hypothetical protein
MFVYINIINIHFHSFFYTFRVFVLNFCVFVFESHNLILFLVWKLDKCTFPLTFVLIVFHVFDKMFHLKLLSIFIFFLVVVPSWDM